ncbi:MAG: hypothetical protein KIB45_06050 [Negativicoccus succinicivorans]|uniref:hypothetical protein n=1 Tax=Negativicoccus succinicivorans TaxID=620903 RepID=UPI002356EB13|nr:hypothetical protein [Negativicoccus succinicivorans]MBS5890626.1 hypothetical protein [Negativicoccus succinicivorans]
MENKEYYVITCTTKHSYGKTHEDIVGFYDNFKDAYAEYIKLKEIGYADGFQSVWVEANGTAASTHWSDEDNDWIL